MAPLSSSETWEFIDSVQLLKSVLEKLHGLLSNPPSLFVDLEGINLSRSGSISLFSLHVAPVSKTYLIDVFGLGHKAFTTEDATGTSLKSILETEDITKVFFDIRNDADALFSLQGIRVRGITDLQVMEFATRDSQPSRFVSGLAKCIKDDCPMPQYEKQKWLRTKDRVGALFSPERGGSYQVFNERPLQKIIAEYSAEDAALLPRLWKAYSAMLTSNTAFWQMMIRKETLKRIEQSQSQKLYCTYQVHGIWALGQARGTEGYEVLGQRSTLGLSLSTE
ncbi:hypothetical protein QQS21_008319 [Conoideocrella luteorostrata]|uniref:3'-5' exonuclease domain-containing protein n=1 Tax=Conoideocrella luteorostrata TaxID=1105319 RepID=A0AAJ0CJ18_9HYPO|nr:hypothetical protein QQS21_008319 [Conoideocrella luteorostrata]